MANDDADRPADRPIVLYDGTCGFCRGCVRFALRHERDASVLYGPLASPAGVAVLVRFGLPAGFRGSVVMAEDRRAYTGSTAVLRLVRHLRRPWRWLAVFRLIPRPLRDAAYYFVARHRGPLPGVADAEIPPDRSIDG